MSFTPLPKIFIDICSNPDSSSLQVLELGCGDGRFQKILADRGIFSWGLDRIGPKGGTVADVVGDALGPPVAVGSLDLLLVPNLLRHLARAEPSLGFLVRWLELLKPGGSLFIFEDEPRDAPAGVSHYRDLQEFLSRLMPESRGPLLPLGDFKARVSALGAAACWDFGLVRNSQTIDAAAVLEFLGQEGEPTGEPGCLMKSIGRDGLDPGYFWWARASATMEGMGA